MTTNHGRTPTFQVPPGVAPGFPAHAALAFAAQGEQSGCGLKKKGKARG